MTPQDIRAAIDADPVLAAISTGDGTDYARIAATLTASYKKVVSTLGSYALVLASVDNGGELLDKLDAASASDANLRWAMRALEEGRFDFGLARVRAGWDALAGAGVITATEAAALKGIAEVPDTVTIPEVAEAMRL